MTRSAHIQRSMSSGEVSPLLHGRADYQRYQTGLARCRGFLPLVEGGVTRAPGTRYLGRTKDDLPARLIEFEFAADDVVTLEFTDGTMRVWRYGALVDSGGSPYELAIPYDWAAIQNLQWAQSADVIYLVDGAQQPQKLSRLALDNWTIAAVDFANGPLRVFNSDEAVTVAASAETGSVTLTASGGDVFDADHVGGLFALRVIDWSNVPLWTGNETVAVNDLMRYGGNVYRVAAGTDTGVNPPTHAKGSQLSAKGKVEWEYVGTDTGLVRITAVASSTSADADVIDRIPSELVGTGTPDWAHGAWSDAYGWPRAIVIHDQRLIMAGTPTEPRTLWASVLAGFEDFEGGTDADLAFSYTVAAQRGLGRILWMESGARGLVIGMLGETQASRSTVAREALSVENVAFDMVAAVGVRDARPISPRGAPAFIARDGGRIFELSYDLSADGMKPRELSRPARHFGAERFAEIAWQSAPVGLAWIRRDDGALLAMLHEPDEDALGWALLPLAGGVLESLSVAAAEGGGDDELTMVIRREIDGTTRRHVERLSQFYGIVTGEISVSEAEHLFAAKLFEFGTATDALTGLEHLEGESVLAWTEQGQFGPYVVSGGAIALAEPVTRALVGLNDDEQSIRTLPHYASARDGDTMGRQMQQRGVGVHLHETAAYRVRSILRSWGRSDVEEQWRERKGADVPGDLRSGWSGVDRPGVPAAWGRGVQLEITPLGAAPVTVLGINPVMEVGG